MNDTRNFRILLVLAVILDLLAFVGFLVIKHPVFSQYEPMDLFREISAPLHALLYIVSVWGLLFFKPFARHVFVIFLLQSIIYGLWVGESIEPRFVDMCESISSLLFGAIFGLIYFSPLREKFMNKKE